MRKNIKYKIGLQKLAIGIIAIFLLSSCDPEFRYEVKGKIEGEFTNPIKINYKFLPIEIAKNWRSNISDSIVLTNQNGEFIIKQSTLTSNLEGIEISINEIGYENIIVSKQNIDWNNSIGLNLRESNFNLNPIQLIKIDTIEACKKGIERAAKEIQNQNFVFHEFLSTRNLDETYLKKFKYELNKLHIEHKIISLTDVEPNSKQEYERHCYLMKMKEGIELKYGENWLEAIRSKIEE